MLFETIWQDRAEKAGWTLNIEYDGEECIFSFKKISPEFNLMQHNPARRVHWDQTSQLVLIKTVVDSYQWRI